MKKIISITLVFALAMALALSLAACGGDKTPVSGATFATAAQSAGWPVYNVIDEYAATDIEQGGITEAYGYADETTEVTYVNHQEADMARVLYDFYKSNAENLKGTLSTESEVGTRYTLESDGVYCHIQQVDTTVVAIVCPAADKSKAEALIEAIGY